MTFIEADNILSPLGMTTEQNVEAVMAGRSALRAHTDGRERLEPYTASLFTKEQWEAMAVEGLTPFESMVVSSARRALSAARSNGCSLDVASARTVLIVSSTKGNVEQLRADTADASELYLGRSAERVARALGVTTTPLTVCNACISGLAAIILAERLLDANLYDHAIVCGADRQSEFIISGFQSLKALSPRECRPFDMERMGLNLGEAAATLILSREQTRDNQWAVRNGSIHNDAYHTTQPAKRGDGLLLCLEEVVEDKRGKIKERNIVESEKIKDRRIVESEKIKDKSRLGEEKSEKIEDKRNSLEEGGGLALINAHGTATLFNDQMESVAIERAGLADVPVNALKGYFGHTMGAAGILEAIVTMHALDHHILIGTRGYEERGVSGRVRLSAAHQPTDKTAFVKTISGFGGCNAAALFEVERDKLKEKRILAEESEKIKDERTVSKTHHVRITPDGVTVDGQPIQTEGTGLTLLTYLYKATGGSYPKFYKMDALSRLGYVAAALIADEYDGFLFFNRSSSIVSDKRYLASIADRENYFPSPSVFIYTLPNIVTGELAIRHGCHGETSFYVLPHRDDALQEQVVRATLAATAARRLLAGWLDYEDDNHFEADLQLYDTSQASNKHQP